MVTQLRFRGRCTRETVNPLRAQPIWVSRADGVPRARGSRCGTRVGRCLPGRGDKVRWKIRVAEAQPFQTQHLPGNARNPRPDRDPESGAASSGQQRISTPLAPCLALQTPLSREV